MSKLQPVPRDLEIRVQGIKKGAERKVVLGDVRGRVGNPSGVE
jgi:hypothetical protein